MYDKIHPWALHDAFMCLRIYTCRLCGSLTVMSVKGVSTALVLTISGQGHPFTSMLPWCMLFTLLGSTVVQIRYAFTCVCMNMCIYGCTGVFAVVLVAVQHCRPDTVCSVYMYVCQYVCKYALYAYMYVCVCMYASMYKYTLFCLLGSKHHRADLAYMYECIYERIRVCMCFSLLGNTQRGFAPCWCMHVWIHGCMSVCLHACTCVNVGAARERYSAFPWKQTLGCRIAMPYISAKEPYISAKEFHMSAKDPSIPVIEPCVYLWKSRICPAKAPSVYRKRAILVEIVWSNAKSIKSLQHACKSATYHD